MKFYLIPMHQIAVWGNKAKLKGCGFATHAAHPLSSIVCLDSHLLELNLSTFLHFETLVIVEERPWTEKNIFGKYFPVVTRCCAQTSVCRLA